MKTKIPSRKLDINLRKISLPNEMHLKACIKGGNVFRDKTKYSRKSKHKNRCDH